MVISKLEPTNIQVNIKDYGSYTVPAGTNLWTIANEFKKSVYKCPIVAARRNNLLINLGTQLTESCEIELVDTTSEVGARIFQRSTTFVLAKACYELFPERQFVVKHTLSNGLFCEFVDTAVQEEEVERIKHRMQQIVSHNLPINKYNLTRTKAIKFLTGKGLINKVNLLKSLPGNNVTLYELDGFYDFFYGQVVPETGILGLFNLIYYNPGMVLQTPEAQNSGFIAPYREQKKLAHIFHEAKDWAKMLNTSYVPELNKIIEAGQIGDLIRINEALHEKKIAFIADQICNNQDIRLVLISGPSSSGKTTFAQRLLIQLKVNGKKPIAISLDDYFVDRDQTPRDENNDFDFEDLLALKLNLFNDHLYRLIRGEKVEIPKYSFTKGTCEPQGTMVCVPEGEPIIIEGIHGLNDQLTWKIDQNKKYKIYVSALTQLNIDYTNRISTTDCRLIRRIVRDNRTRNYKAINTIKRWPSVRRGEEKNIFPYQENADIMFNSFLMYEMAVLKKQAEPLLQTIGPEQYQYAEAQRLLEFLDFFKTAPEDDIPQNSIIREFIGESCFEV